MKRAVVWVAVSSEDQARDDKLSLGMQERLCREWADNNGYDVIRVLKVDGYSRGYTDVLEAYLEYQKLGVTAYHEIRDMWQRQAFDALVVYTESRLGRSTALMVHVISNVIKSGAKVVVVEKGTVLEDAGQASLFTAFGGVMTESEVRRLRAGKRAWREKRIKQGLPIGGSVHSAYKVIRDKRGKVIDMQVKPEMVAQWRQVAQLIIEGVPYTSLEIEMAKRHGVVSPKSGKPYYVNKFYNQITSPTFWGHSELADGSNPDTATRSARWRYDARYADEKPDNGVMIEYNTHEPVLTGDIAQRLLAEIYRRGNLRGRGRHNSATMFVGLFVCGHCGHSMIAQRAKERIHCVSRYQRITRRGESQRDCTVVNMIRYDEIIEWFTPRLKRAFETQDFNALVGDTSEIEAHYNALQARLSALEDEIGVLIEEQAHAPVSTRQVYRDKIRAKSDEAEELRSEIASVSATVNNSGGYAQQQAIEEIAQMGIDTLWSQSEDEINRLLHAALGGYKLVVYDRKIAGVV